MGKRYHNFIFDFDGTLMDTSAAILATIRATIDAMGLPSRTEVQCRSIIGIRTDEAGHHLYPDVEIDDADFARVFRSIYPTMQERLPATPFENVIECLDNMRQSGHALAIASSRRRDSIFGFLNDLGIADWFSIVIGAEDVVKGKPNPDPVLKILDSKGWNPEDTLVVGDADVDILMGNVAGCDTCAVTYGNGSLSSLQGAHPTYIIDRFQAISDVY
ncbi:MAG: HAD family hydrolase [Bacteroidales bacterium]|nr:HAD family hydrolase [Bacteroidales bacterium]